MKAQTLPNNSEVEAQVRRLCQESGLIDEATTLALRTYGVEVLRFLCAFLKSETDGADVFAIFAEDVWKGIAGFDWECSLRGWLYVVARRAATRTMRDDTWRKKAVLGSAASPAIVALVEKVRTETLVHLKTETKSKLRALRESLDEEDRALLMLRVDRNLSWEELARVLSDDTPMDDEQMKRELARLRKRFQLVKERLKKLAKEAGLLASE